MHTLLRAFCVAACIFTGLYYLLLFRFYNNLKKTLWFPVLCITLAFSIIQQFALTPYIILRPNANFGITDNLFLFTFNLSSLTMNLYNGNMISDGKNIYYKIFNYFTLAFSIVCMLLPGHLTAYAYVLTVIVSAIAYIYGLYASFKMYNTVSKTYIYGLISHTLLLTTLVPSIILFISHTEFISFRVIVIPVYLGLNVLMLTLQYRQSIFRTKKLADSLSAAIEKINHSDNALQCTQLKSDFLYRTLDLIKEKCDTDSFTAEELTIALSKFLRHTLNFQQLKGTVPLSNELELTKAFITIERERHPDITFKYELPAELPEINIPPLSIQPLFENSIEYAFSDGRKEKSITLSVYKEAEHYKVEVYDNGKGMPPEELAGLPDAFPYTARVGLYSINRRLIALFGKGLDIKSAPELGTSVSFTVPVVNETGVTA